MGEIWSFDLCKPCFYCGTGGPYGGQGISAHEGNSKRPDDERTQVMCSCGRRGPAVPRSFENGMKLWEILRHKDENQFMNGGMGLSPADKEAWRLWDLDQEFLHSIAKLKAENELLLASREGVESKQKGRL